MEGRPVLKGSSAVPVATAVKCAIIQSGIEPDSKGAPPRRLGGVGSIFVGSETRLAFVIRIADHERNPPFARLAVWRGAGKRDAARGQCLVTRRCVGDPTHDREAADRSRRQTLRFRSWCPGRPN